MSDMVHRSIEPALSSYCGELAARISSLKSLSVSSEYEIQTLQELNALSNAIFSSVRELDSALEESSNMEISKAAQHACEVLRPLMHALRKHVDAAELICPAKLWPFPSYSELLFSVV